MRSLRLLRLSVSSRSRLRYSVQPWVSINGTCSTGRIGRELPPSEFCTRESCACPLGPPVRDSSTVHDACRQPRPRPRGSGLFLARQSRSVHGRRIFHSAYVYPSVRIGALGVESVQYTVRRIAAPCIVHDDLPPLRQRLPAVRNTTILILSRSPSTYPNQNPPDRAVSNKTSDGGGGPISPLIVRRRRRTFLLC